MSAIGSIEDHGEYRDWKITYDAWLPVTGRWRAEWRAVGMCNSTEEGLKRMIDWKVKEALERRK